MKRIPLTLLIALCSVSLIHVGCSDEAATTTKKADHDGHEDGDDDDHGHGEEGHKHPETFSEAVEQIGTMSADIKAAFAEDPDGGTAHDDLHEIGELLEDAKALVEKEDSLSDDVKKSVIESVDTLFKAFGDVDLGMHEDDKGAKYPDVADTIDSAVAALKDAVK